MVINLVFNGLIIAIELFDNENSCYLISLQDRRTNYKHSEVLTRDDLFLLRDNISKLLSFT